MLMVVVTARKPKFSDDIGIATAFLSRKMGKITHPKIQCMSNTHSEIDRYVEQNKTIARRLSFMPSYWSDPGIFGGRRKYHVYLNVLNRSLERMLPMPIEKMVVNIGRIGYFWNNPKGQASNNILLNLLRTYDPDVSCTSPAFELERLGVARDAYDEVVARMGGICKAPMFKKILCEHGAWMLWPQIEDELNQWDDLPAERHEAIINVAYAMSNIYLTTWFLDRLLARVPSLKEGALEPYVTPTAKQERCLSDATERGDLENSAPVPVQTPEQEWGALNSVLADLSGRIVAAAKPNNELIEELQAITARYVDLAGRCSSQSEGIRFATTRIKALITYLRTLAEGEDFAWLPVSDLEMAWGARLMEAVAANEDCGPIESDAERALIDTTAVENECRGMIAKTASLRDESDQLKSRALKEPDRRHELRQAARQIDGELEALMDHLTEAEVKLVDGASPNGKRDTETDWRNRLATAAKSGSDGLEAAEVGNWPLTLLDCIEVGDISSAQASDELHTPEIPADENQPEESQLTIEEELVQNRAANVCGLDIERESEVAPQPDEVQVVGAEPAVNTNATPDTPPIKAIATPTEPPMSMTTSEDPIPAAPRPSLELPDPVVERIWQYASESEPALAARLSHLSGKKPIPVELFELAALAKGIQMPNGVLAQEIGTRLVSGDLVEAIENLGGNDRFAASLVGLGASFRPVLLVSNPGMTALLTTIKIHGRLPATGEVVDALLKASATLQSFPMTAEVLRQIINYQSRETSQEQIAESARAWLGTVEERSRTRFHAARHVFRHMCQQGDDGWFHNLLNPVALKDKKHIEKVREYLALMQDETRFSRKIEELNRYLVKRAEKIAYHALDWLREERLAAIEIATNWLTFQDLDAEKGYIQNVTQDALKTAHARRDQVFEELTTVAQSGDQPAASAAVVAIDGFQSFLSMCEQGISLPPVEPLASHLLYEPLLRIPGQHVGATGEPDINPDKEAELDALQRATLLPWDEVWKVKADEGDFHGADLASRRLSAEEQSSVGERLAQMEQTLRSQLLAQARQLEQTVRSVGRMRGMTSGMAELLEEVINAEIANLQQESRPPRRLDQTRKNLHDASVEINAAESALASQLQTQLEEAQRRGAHSSLLERIQKNIAQKNFVVAHEYLELAEHHDGNALELIERQESDHFAYFYPERAATIAKEIADLSTADVVATIEAGGEIGGISFADLDEDWRRESAAQLWKKWRDLKSRRGNIVGTSEYLEDIARLLGFGHTPVASKTGTANPDRIELYLDTERIADRHLCPVHQYGSSANGHYRVVICHNRPTPQDMVRIANESANSTTPTIIFLTSMLSERQRRELGEECRNRKATLIVVDDSVVLYLCAHDGNRLPVLFACTLPFSGLDPYVTVANQMLPPEMFFGRDRELRDILDPRSSCLVFGGRQLGKTALLREAERRFHNPDTKHYAFHNELKNVLPSEIWSRIRAGLARAGVNIGITQGFDPEKPEAIEKFTATIEQWLKDHPSARILALLDEADTFMSRDSLDNYRNTERIKQLMSNTQGRFKAVFAGLHNVLRMSTRSNHPLAHLGIPIHVGPFIENDDVVYAYRLIMDPLKALGYRFAGNEQVTQILGQTNYYPSLIQIYCQQLLTSLSAKRRERGGAVMIDAKTIDSAYQTRRLSDLIKNKLDITLQLDQRYAVIALSLAHEIAIGGATQHAGLDVGALRRLVDHYWPEGFASTTASEFRALLDELKVLGILRQPKSTADRYTFRNANVLMLMGSQSEIASELATPREVEEEVDPSLVHSHIESTARHARSPFTRAQERQLRDARGQVLIVAGTDLSPLDRVQEGLRCVFEQQVMKVPGKADGAMLTSKLNDLRARCRNDKQPGVLLVGQDVEWKTSWLRSAANRLHEAADVDLRIIFVAGPGMLRKLVEEKDAEQFEVLTLEPWNENFVYAWLNDLGVVLDPQTRRNLYRVTGGWGGLLAEVVGRNAALESILTNIGQLADISVEDRKLWQKRLGVTADNGLRRSAEFLEILGANIPTEDLPEFFDENPAPWIRWAQLLGFAVWETESDGWKLNPLVAEVFRTEMPTTQLVAA